MDDLWQVIAEFGQELHPERILSVASKLETLETEKQFVLAKPFFHNIDKSLIDRLESAWRNATQVRPKELAAALKAASATARLYERHGSVEMVWTGPSTGMVPIRHTEQVLCEVIESARNRLFIVSFVAYEVASINKSLKDAAERQVRIDIMLESSLAQGGKVSVDSVATMKDTIPSANIYAWHVGQAINIEHLPGSVHAKCAVSDGNLAFITSANLSVAAMERNMELGVLIRGGHLPNRLHRHLDILVETKIIRRV